jgi:DNA-directed RNA polymerase specialized sigma24 family protein
MSPKPAGSPDEATASPPDLRPVATTDAAAWEKMLAFIDCEGLGPTEAYRSVRARLLKFFAWRGSYNVEELADETLSRVAFKLAQSEVQADRPVLFVLGVARIVFLEWKRREGRWVTFDDDTSSGVEPALFDDDKERLLAALELCLQQLSEIDRRLMLRYHEPRGERRAAVRQAIADELATALNALRVRMHRMRLQIEACVKRRLAAGSLSA